MKKRQEFGSGSFQLVEPSGSRSAQLVDPSGPPRADFRAAPRPPRGGWLEVLAASRFGNSFRQILRNIRQKCRFHRSVGSRSFQLVEPSGPRAA
eukprot:4775451-Lingulodinium_polyedra.AAC.1